MTLVQVACRRRDRLHWYVNIIVDMLYLLINPRIRVGEAMNQKEKLGKVTTSAFLACIGAMSPGTEDRDGYPCPRRAQVGPPALRFPYGLGTRSSISGAPCPASTCSERDHVGRDIFARVPYGGRFPADRPVLDPDRTSFFGAIIGSVTAAVVRKRSKRVLMDIMAVPGIAMAAVSVLVFGRTPSKPVTRGAWWSIICSIALRLHSAALSRIVSANVMAATVRTRPCRDRPCARAPWILAKHVMRNTAAPGPGPRDRPVADAIIPRGLP